MRTLSPLAPRRDFPALQARPGHRPPAYLDSACMSLVPRAVLEAQEEYYRDYPGCAGRSVHRWAEEVQRRYEEAREAFARFFQAPGPRHLVNVRNSTEGLNAVAQGLSLRKGATGSSLPTRSTTRTSSSGSGSGRNGGSASTSYPCPRTAPSIWRPTRRPSGAGPLW